MTDVCGSDERGRRSEAQVVVARGIVKAIVAASLLVGLGLCGCSTALQVTVLNATDDAITVRRDVRYVWQDRLVRIPRHGVRAFAPGEIALDEAVLTAKGCRYAFRIPFALAVGEPRGGSRMAVQVEPDLSIVVVARRARAVVPREAWDGRQPEGFPLHPNSVDCG